MTNKITEQQRATRTASKQDRERDAVTAMQEYEAEKAAVLAKTARLRAIRLANEAAKASEQAANAATAKRATAKVAAKPRPATKNKSLKR